MSNVTFDELDPGLTFDGADWAWFQGTQPLPISETPAMRTFTIRFEDRTFTVEKGVAQWTTAS